MPIQSLVIIFPNRASLTQALEALRDQHAALLEHAALIVQAEDNEVKILEDDLSVDEGALAGGTLGAAMTTLGLVQLGALLLPSIGAILALGTGALVGGLLGGVTGHLAANLMDFGFDNARIEQLATRLQGKRPALVLRVDDAPATQSIKNLVAGYGGEVVNV
jgi:uncharacterized membrane protein